MQSEIQSVGILLVTTGSPDAPTTPAVRRYLAAFQADRQVVDLPPALWWPILHGVVLRVRPRRSAARYRWVWTPEGSPPLVGTQALAARLQQRLRDCLPDRQIPVAVGMRYATPGLAAGMRELTDAGAERVVVLPLFPHYSAATTGSVRIAAESVRRTLTRRPRGASSPTTATTRHTSTRWRAASPSTGSGRARQRTW